MSKTIFFSGSGARIASHLGAAMALNDRGIVGDSYGGISGGAIVATFAAMGVLDEVKDEILNSRAGNVFFPPIFNKEGNARPLMSLLGWCLHGPRAVASLAPLKKRLLKLDVWSRWNHRKPLYTYLYKREEGIVIEYSSKYTWREWIDVLMRGAAIPGVIDAGDYSDAGIVRQLPLEDSAQKEAICFVTARKSSSDYLIDDVLRRLAEDNIKDEEQILRKEGFKLNVYHLPSQNRTTQYEEKLLKQSFSEAFDFVRGQLP